MIRGFYSAAAGMLGQIQQQDVISNNLANVNTPGFKRTTVSFEGFAASLADAERGTGMRSNAKSILPIPTTSQDTHPGMVEDTSSPTNLAIEGSGFFVVQAPDGERLTRGGDFSVDSSGRLTTSSGYPVLGNQGPINVKGSEWSVKPDGSVIVDGREVDKLKIQSDTNGRGSTTPGQVVQGSLEGSNVNTVQEMVSMITALRSYEANQKTIQSLDQTLDKIINIAGRTA